MESRLSNSHGNYRRKGRLHESHLLISDCRMTFVERYNQETTWQGKVIVMSLFHMAMTNRDKNWTVSNTASSFVVSNGLVSENLRLAKLLDTDIEIAQLETRQEALERLRK